MRVLALDLAMRSCAGVTLDGEEIRQRATVLPKGEPGAAYRQLLHAILEWLVRQRPDVLVVEKPEKWERAKDATATLEAMYGAWAVCQLAHEEYGRTHPITSKCRLVRWDPAAAKELIAGDRRASKEMVWRALEMEGFDLTGWSEHEVDALAIAIAYQRTEGRLGEGRDDA